MKIISNFKDYYDYIINKYGVDDKIVFYRNNKKILIPSKKTQNNFFFNESYLINDEGKRAYFENDVTSEILIKRLFLYFCGEYYLIELVKKIDKKKNSTNSTNISKEFKKFGFEDYFIENNIATSLIYDSYMDENLNFGYKVELNPKLINLNFQSLFEPEQVYQNIEQYLGKIKVKDSHFYIDNENKIKQAGFDVKTSFRKRKN